jgi:hypothetical protein
MFTNHSADDHQPLEKIKPTRGRPKGTTKKSASSSTRAIIPVDNVQRIFAFAVKSMIEVDSIDKAYMYIFEQGIKAIKSKIKKKNPDDTQDQ